MGLLWVLRKAAFWTVFWGNSSVLYSHSLILLTCKYGVSLMTFYINSYIFISMIFIDSLSFLYAISLYFSDFVSYFYVYLIFMISSASLSLLLFKFNSYKIIIIHVTNKTTMITPKYSPLTIITLATVDFWKAKAYTGHMSSCHYSCADAWDSLGCMPKRGIPWHMVCVSSTLLDNANMFSSVVSNSTPPVVCNNACWSMPSIQLVHFPHFVNVK